MLTFLIILHVIVAVFMILVVLLQPGNKGGVSAALGGAGGETAFGGRGANTFLTKLTFVAAALFMCTNVSLSLLSSPDTSAMNKLLEAQNSETVAPSAENSEEKAAAKPKE